ncbi:MAG: hypothetical protein IJ356_02075 [Erysipelotrichaceae bacterium]|nr:hypothetical protein [Erysipelotrichaceae bacterium]
MNLKMMEFVFVAASDHVNNERKDTTTMKKIIKTSETKQFSVPVGKFHSGDYFKCMNCEYTVRMLVLGNTATCSKCGGRMVRI